MEIYHDMYVLQLYKFVWGYSLLYSIQWDKNISKMAEKIDDVSIFFRIEKMMTSSENPSLWKKIK